MIKGILRSGTSKNLIFLTGRQKFFISSKILSVKSQNLTNVPVIGISFTQKRFCSNSSGSAIHKVFFVSAESPDPNTNNAAFNFASDSTENILHPLLNTNNAASNFASDSTENILPPLLDTNNDTSKYASDSIEYIPPPPSVPPEVTDDAAQVLNILGEPTLQSLGLGSWYPPGLIQSALEFLHVSGGLPWWGSIAVATVIMRTLLFPLVIKAQRNNAIMNNNMPKMQELQKKVTEARNSGNNYEAAKASLDMQKFMMKSGFNPFKNMMVPLIQAPIFVSFFMGLRACTNLPVESMKLGGMLWFTDLTISDPYYLLPLITTATLFITIEIGADATATSTSKVVKHFLRAIPIVVFPFIMHFPSAILCYWASTNFVTLLQVAFLRIPKVRNYFKIEPLIKHDKSKLPSQSKGVVKDFKESWSNMKNAASIRDRQKLDEMRFKQAGMGPLVKTFKHNPLAVKAKSRD